MRDPAKARDKGDEGFLLVGCIVAIFLVLLVLSVAAPRIGREIQRDREVEAGHRANQYVRAIQLYYKKFGHYPGSIEQLEQSNNQRFLRQRYADPLTGKDDWRIIHVGENKTTVKGLFGEPLAGLSSGLGSAAGLASPTVGSSVNGTTAGSASSGGMSAGSTGGLGGGTSILGGSSTAAGSGGLAGSTNTTGTTGTGGISGTGTSTAGSPGVTSQSATSITGTGGLIMGVGSASSGEAIVVVNEQDTYETWEFLYDPRIEQLKAKANLFGGGITSGSSSTGVGTTLGSTIGTPVGAPAGTTGSSPTTPTSTTPPTTPP